jgi:hypothetical protein
MKNIIRALQSVSNVFVRSFYVNPALKIRLCALRDAGENWRLLHAWTFNRSHIVFDFTTGRIYRAGRRLIVRIRHLSAVCCIVSAFVSESGFPDVNV